MRDRPESTLSGPPVGGPDRLFVMKKRPYRGGSQNGVVASPFFNFRAGYAASGPSFCGRQGVESEGRRWAGRAGGAGKPERADARGDQIESCVWKRRDRRRRESRASFFVWAVSTRRRW